MKASEVLKNVEEMIMGIEDGVVKKYRINEVYRDLAIFDWWNDYLSKTQLKQMRTFLKEAIKLGYVGHVSFKVGASGCANGMWAYTAESDAGYAPDGEFLYRSFSSEYTYWSVRDADGNIWPSIHGDEFDSAKTIKDIEAVIAAL